MDLRRIPFRRVVTLLFVFIVGAAILGGMALIAFNNNSRSEISLPVLAIIGVIALLVALTLMSIIFSILGLSDRNQALGLPEGTIRAVIALSLIVIFVIASIFLYSTLAFPQGTLLEGLTESQVNSIPAAQLQYRFESGTNEAGAKTYSVTIANTASAAGGDFAKQMLTMLGALVTAITSFYFGTTAGGRDSGRVRTSPPKLTGVSPRTLTAGGAVSLTIQGDNLLAVTEVVLSQIGGAAVINATNVLSNDTTVTAAFDIDPDVKGKFDVMIRTNDGNSTRMESAIEITPAAAQSSG